MKNLMKLFSMICLLGLLIACTLKEKDQPAPQETPEENNPGVVEKTTVIYIVRHAEKSTNHPSDPDLSAAGQARALALKDTLNKVSLAAIFTTNYKRTQQTVAPVAAAKKLTPGIYQPSDLSTLATKIMKDYLNKTVLIAGHSNTLLETIEAFNLTRPVPVINENEYNYLFKITLKENKPAVVEVKRYGN